MISKHLESLFEATTIALTCEGEVLAAIKLSQSRGILLSTTSMHKVPMPMPEKYADQARIELYFMLPSYWNIDEQDPLFHWAMVTLVRIKKYLEQGHWAINGNTFNLTNLPEGRFKAAGFSALMLMAPMAMSELVNPISIGDEIIHFKALCPLSAKEKDVKEARGHQKFLERMNVQGMSECIDEFRGSIVKSRLLFWK